MARDERQRLRVWLGALLIAGLVAAAVTVFFLDDVIAALRSEYTIVAVLAEAPGVHRGSAVWIGGAEAGIVTSVALLPTGADTTARVALTLELPRRLQPQVRTDSRVRLTTASLVSAPVVDITPGSTGAAVLADMDTLRQLPGERLTPAQLTARAGALRAELDTVLRTFHEIAPPLRARLNATLAAFTALEAAAADGSRIATDVRDGPGMRLFGDPAFAASLERARSHIGELPRMLGQLDTRRTGMTDVNAAIGRLQARADSLRAELDAAAALVNPNSSLARFRQDTAVFRALNAARAELDSLIAEMRRNPMRFVF